MKKQLHLLTLIGALAFSSSALATPKHTLNKFRAGKVVSGPKVHLSKMEGKVVVIDYWGVNCPPCLALMPHMAKLHKRYADDGLVLIAAESQGSPDSAIQKIIKKNHLECTVTRGVSGPSLSNRLPYMAIFDVEGKMVYAGQPGGKADQIIKKELKRVTKDGASASADTSGATTGPLVKNRTWTDAKGRKMNAALIKLDGTIGTFRKVGGNPFPYDISKLTEADQKLIQEAGTK